ncbi:Non-classical phosphatidylinositol transfer protein (PITP) [Coemansia spiralis]|uniref:Non-classical phosphatidylinositol transfer protein (PITP) n=1 Tax=Coemansia spiralis TaxID=417178 RepID=A0A9W8GG11_9FUNG|nr:Non-classical phosphatidylinositol transfer protein (PITP) [Coemansia spiralis]
MSMLGKVQNFTEAETDLISQLRELLPQAIEDAGKLSSEPVDPAIWGVPLLSVDKERDLRVDVILHKFLKARNGDIAQAQQMLTNTLKWRAEFKISGILDEEFPEDVFGKVGYVHGTDGEGRPVTYNFYGSLDNKQVFGDLERFLRWRVQLHERGMRGLDFVDVADMIQVHDYDGVSVFGYDKVARAASKATVQVMSDNYPETLATKIFANVPGWGETVFNVICRWLSEDTKKKFVVVSKVSAPRVLAERIGETNLPEKFRGAAAEQPRDATATEPQPLAAEPAPPMTAHADHNEGAPRPTSRGSQQSGSGASDIDSQDVDEASPPPPPPVATAAPELEPQPEALVSETAGLRLDDGATVDTQEHGDKHGSQI